MLRSEGVIDLPLIDYVQALQKALPWFCIHEKIPADFVSDADSRSAVTNHTTSSDAS